MRLLTIEEAEKLAGKRLDRRRQYATTDNGQRDEWWDALVFELCRWVATCSGCFESEDGHPCGQYPIHPKHGCYIGAGCHECGFHGIRRRAMWVPVVTNDLED